MQYYTSVRRQSAVSKASIHSVKGLASSQHQLFIQYLWIYRYLPRCLHSPKNSHIRDSRSGTLIQCGFGDQPPQFPSEQRITSRKGNVSPEEKKNLGQPATHTCALDDPARIEPRTRPPIGFDRRPHDERHKRVEGPEQMSESGERESLWRSQSRCWTRCSDQPLIVLIVSHLPMMPKPGAAPQLACASPLVGGEESKPWPEFIGPQPGDS
ncbi:hypothetical protein GE09DRAFT_369956 [Coniochaeta sp. 2T2.1]|nr:hypothetical protein GE09DRAFT_369956 [Coniochaeta sp. 2T2.1]